VSYGCGWVSEWVGFKVPINTYRSFRRRVFPVNHIHVQPNKNNPETEHTKNTKLTQHTKRPSLTGVKGSKMVPHKFCCAPVSLLSEICGIRAPVSSMALAPMRRSTGFSVTYSPPRGAMVHTHTGSQRRLVGNARSFPSRFYWPQSQ